MRDKVIHFYFGVKWEIVWSVVNEKIAELLPEIETIIRQLEEK